MKTVTIVVKVKALPVRGYRSMAVNYVRQAVQGWQGGMDPDCCEVEDFEWRKATVKGVRNDKGPV